MTTPQEALEIFNEAELTNLEMHELIGRLTVLAPNTLVKAICHLKEDRK